jgi:hypothetical protein
MSGPGIPTPGNIAFQQPYVLLLSLAIPLLWLVAGPRLRSVPAGQRRAALMVRSLMLAVLVTALAEPVLTLHRPSLELSIQQLE